MKENPRTIRTPKWPRNPRLHLVDEKNSQRSRECTETVSPPISPYSINIYLRRDCVRFDTGANGGSEKSSHVLVMQSQRCNHLEHTVPGHHPRPSASNRQVLVLMRFVAKKNLHCGRKGSIPALTTDQVRWALVRCRIRCEMSRMHT